MNPEEFEATNQGYAQPPTGTFAAPASNIYDTAGGGMTAPPAYPYRGAPVPPGYAPRFAIKKTDEMAIVSLICGAGSFIIFPFFPAIAAVVLGVLSRNRIRSDPVHLEGDGLAITGIILGVLNLVLVLAVVIIIVVIFALEAA